MTNTASGITGLLPAPTWRGWMAITREVQEGRLDIVYCCCVLLYVYCSTLLLCALSVSWWWKGIYLSDSKTPITWNHYIITSATLRMQIHTDVPLMYTGYPNTHIALFTDFFYTNKHTKKNPWNITSPCDLTTDLVFLKHGIGSLPQLVKHLPLTLSLFAGFATKQQPANVLEVPTRTAFYLTAANAPSLLSQNGSRKSFQESGRVSSQRHSQAGFQSHYF